MMLVGWVAPPPSTPRELPGGGRGDQRLPSVFPHPPAAQLDRGVGEVSATPRVSAVIIGSRGREFTYRRSPPGNLCT